jgi:hypothetical protein
MKQTFLMAPLQNAAKRIPMGLGFALAVTFPHLNATAQEVNLGAANSFAVLSYSGLSVAGAVNSSTINGGSENNGNIGSFPTASTGLGNLVINNGVNEAGNSLTQNAQTALAAAYSTAFGLTPHSATDYTTYNGGNLGGLTLTPGVYTFSSTAAISSGTLYLNDGGNPDAVFVFQIGSTLITAANTAVVEEDVTSTGDIIDNNPGMSVFWQVGSSATLGAASTLEGNILANTSITLGTTVTVDGRLLAEGGAVVLDGSDTINVPLAERVPDTGSTLLLLGSGVAALLAFGRRFSSVA